MTIKEFFNQYRRPILYWFIFGAAVLIAAGAIWWSWSENLKVNNIETVEIIKTNLCGPEPPAMCVTGMRLTCENGEWSCKETEEKKKIIGKIVFSDIEGGCWGFQSDNGKYFLIGGDDKSEEIKKIPDILSKKVEIQGKIEKDIASYCPVGDGLFELELYRIINDNATDISDWKTYRSEEYGFEVKYPEDWITEESGNPKINAFDLILQNSFQENPKFEISVNPGGIGYEYLETTSIDNLIISNYQATKISFISETKDTVWDCGNRGIKGFRLYFNKNINNNSFWIWGISCLDDNNTDLFNQILSTFKFVD